VNWLGKQYRYAPLMIGSMSTSRNFRLCVSNFTVTVRDRGDSGSPLRQSCVSGSPTKGELFFIGKVKCHSRVTMNIIVSSETIAVRLQKICTLSPGRCSSAAAARSPFQVLGPPLVTVREVQQLSLGIRKVASSGDIAEPHCEFPVMRAAVLLPPIPIVHHLSRASIPTETSAPRVIIASSARKVKGRVEHHRTRISFFPAQLRMRRNYNGLPAKNTEYLPIVIFLLVIFNFGYPRSTGGAPVEATLIGSLRARAGFWDDHEGEVLDMLVQRRRDSRAALRLTRKLRLPRFSGRFVSLQSTSWS
jgi:hypothetical protein